MVDGWQLHTDKQALRDAAPSSDEGRVHNWLLHGTETGQLVRQEVASMLPVCLLDVQPSSVVLDMCASPGSKTTQVIERLGTGGVVVANDASPLRCYTLAKRTAEAGSRAACLVVTCHRAQVMPALPAVGGYDRIVCDVPCTGDGTTRKHPEVFTRWEVALALRQHPLQLQIAMRGAALLKIGGLMTYSTCSLNPIENEAVVAELLRRCDGALELVNGAAGTATLLAGGCAPGMTRWHVLDFQLEAHEDIHSIRNSPVLSAGEKRLYLASMFPPSPGSEAASALANCVRLLPHRADCGGFFVAVLRKCKPLPAHPAPVWRHRKDQAPIVAARTRPASSRDTHRYYPIPESICATLVDVYGKVAAPENKAKRRRNAKKGFDRQASAAALSLIRHNLYSRTATAGRIVYLTDSSAQVCVNAETSRLHVVHAGATLFIRRRRRQPKGDIASSGKTLIRFAATAAARRLLALRADPKKSTRRRSRPSASAPQ